MKKLQLEETDKDILSENRFKVAQQIVDMINAGKISSINEIVAEITFFTASDYTLRRGVRAIIFDMDLFRVN